MAQINGYRDEFSRGAYYPPRNHPREEPHYKREDHHEQRYGGHQANGYRNQRIPASHDYRNGHRDDVMRPRDPRDDIPRSRDPRDDIPRSRDPRDDIPRSRDPRDDIPRSRDPRDDIPRSRDPREELYSKVVREPRLDGYKPYKIETEEIPMKSYELDHLATFTVGTQHGLTTPKDGIQRLRTMQSQAGIWTMRVDMLIEPQDVVILDKQSGEEMERFPLQLVQEPTAVIDQKPRDVYNNILLFTVREDHQKTALTEMHIFQVIKKSAQQVVDEVLFAKEKVSRSGRPNVANNPSPHIQERIKKYEEEAKYAYAAAAKYNPDPGVGRQFQQSMKRPDDTDTVVTQRTDRDVDSLPKDTLHLTPEIQQQFLNHCFDDIEKFVGRLQQAADAFRELDHRRRGRGDRSREKQGYRHGDGMLTMRARPPPARDFIDVFQKFKLSFNLLAKLKPHIHDPNAPELVHFLFTPLSLVVEASKDPRHGTPDLASKVVSPLLTIDAKDLLQNCLTSKEADLWMSLGDAWTISRDQWKGYVPPYVPRFSDGWQPDPSWIDDSQPHSTMGRSDSRDRKPEESYTREEPPSHRYQAEPPRPDPRDAYYRDTTSPPPSARSREAEMREAQRREAEQREWENRQREKELAERAQREREDRDRRWAEEQARMNKDRVPPGTGPKPVGPGSQPRDSFDEAQDRFIRELMSRKAKIYVARHPREGKNDKELTVTKGEVVEVLDESRNWWKLRNSHGVEGYAPYTILEAYLVNGNAPTSPSLYNHHYHHHPPSPPPTNHHTSLLTTTIPSIPRPDHASTPRGMVNTPHTRESSPGKWPQNTTESPAEQKTTTNGETSSQDSSSSSTEQSAIRSSRNDLHNELIKTLHKKKAKTKGQVPGSRAAPVYINQKSNPADVRAWLNGKGFSSSIQMTLYGHTGADLFSLSKAKLERLFGHEEASRLYSQITVQRNIAGYSMGKSSELQAILKQRRVKAEHAADDSGIESNNQTGDAFEAVLNISDVSDEK